MREFRIKNKKSEAITFGGISISGNNDYKLNDTDIESDVIESFNDYTRLARQALDGDISIVINGKELSPQESCDHIGKIYDNPYTMIKYVNYNSSDDSCVKKDIYHDLTPSNGLTSDKLRFIEKSDGSFALYGAIQSTSNISTNTVLFDLSTIGKGYGSETIVANHAVTWNTNTGDIDIDHTSSVSITSGGVVSIIHNKECDALILSGVHWTI